MVSEKKNDIQEIINDFTFGLNPGLNAKGFWKKLFKIGDTIERILIYISAFCLFIFLGSVALDVFMRELFTPILWGQEASLFSFIWSIFTGGAVVFRKKQHLVMSILPEFSGKIGFILELVVWIVSFIFICFFLIGGYNFLLTGLVRVSRPSGFPLIYSYISILISVIAMILFSIERFYLDITNYSKW